MEKSSDAFRTISEVADDLDLPQHVLRFWETRFSHIRPLKRAGGRRYYRPADVILLRTIRALLYDQGYTIKGVQRLLKEHGPRGLTAELPPPVDLPLDLNEQPIEPLNDGTSEASEFVPSQGASPLSHAKENSRLTSDDQDTLLEMLAVIEECTRILEGARRPSN